MKPSSRVHAGTAADLQDQSHRKLQMAGEPRLGSGGNPIRVRRSEIMGLLVGSSPFPKPGTVPPWFASSRLGCVVCWGHRRVLDHASDRCEPRSARGTDELIASPLEQTLAPKAAQRARDLSAQPID